LVVLMVACLVVTMAAVTAGLMAETKAEDLAA